jgi:hypothetical protein
MQLEHDGRVLLHFRFPCLQEAQAFIASSGGWWGQQCPVRKLASGCWCQLFAAEVSVKCEAFS